MKLPSNIALLAVLACAAPASAVHSSTAGYLATASSMDRILATDMPAWSLHFGVLRYPGLDPLQEAKTKIERLQSEIEAHERAIAEKRARIENLAGKCSDSHVKSLFLLGLYGRDTCVRDFALVHDEKSLLWGAIKWGKRRP